ncbi:nitroreductase family protein [Sinomonas sp. R1AF57]|uniref:nitroreductase family protein n=1 Tax=Sinomonas sp. R1AF57 TaxID=2020377 RepID=UPI000B5E4C29|nr:nitroreductase [Sinomonas sp. R1AF57]
MCARTVEPNHAARTTANSDGAAATTSLTPLLLQRWSPRSFDRLDEVSTAETDALLEAARWAPSSRNGQSRRFVVGRRGCALFERIAATLSGRNAVWAPNAALLVVGVLMRTDEQGRALRFAEYDLGQAVGHMAVQAEALGLRMRQMGGFDRNALAASLALDAVHEPFVVAAVGRQAPAGWLDAELAEREGAARERLPLADLVLARD